MTTSSASRDAGRAGRVLLLGVGNVLWADEGFGVRALEAFAETYETPDNVSLIDGGTQGLYLVDLFRDHERVLLFDCVDFGAPAATLHVARDDEIPAFIGAKKMSLHQTGVMDVIACAELMGAKPSALTVIGVQPEELDDYGGSLRDSVRAMIAPSLDKAVEELTRWGVRVTRRETPAAFGIDALRMERYEAERPPADAACRIGDERVLPTSDAA
jgi:hydrogenase maturation protease